MSDFTPARRRRWPLFAPIAIVVIFAAAWTGFWYFAAHAAEQNIVAWMEQEARYGRVYNCGSRTFGGYPFRIEMRCTDPVAEIKAGPLTLKAKEFLAVAQVYQPNLIIGEITGPLSIAAPDKPPMLTGTWRLAQASVHLTLAPMPERISIVIEDAKFDSPAASGAQGVANANHIELHVRVNPASTTEKPALDLAATITGATSPNAGTFGARPVDAEVTAVLRGVNDFKPKPLPVRLKEWQAAGGRLEITNIRVKQGDAVAVATGNIGLSAAGRVDGMIALTLAGFDQLVQSLLRNQGKNTGLLAVAGLSFLGKPAEIDGKRAIAVPLRFADGAVFFGPIPLGKTLPLY
jgi:hypothetical protein